MSSGRVIRTFLKKRPPAGISDNRGRDSRAKQLIDRVTDEIPPGIGGPVQDALIVPLAPPALAPLLPVP